MNSYNVVITENAEQDLWDLFDVIAHDFCDPATAQRHISDIEEACLSLDDMPYRFPLCHEKLLSKLGFRMLSLKRYKIIYRVIEDEKRVDILTIAHELRNLGMLLLSRLIKSGEL